MTIGIIRQLTILPSCIPPSCPSFPSFPSFLRDLHFHSLSPMLHSFKLPSIACGAPSLNYGAESQTHFDLIRIMPA
jgi:hypothetical protein